MRYWIILILTASCVITSISVFDIIEFNEPESELMCINYSTKLFSSTRYNQISTESSTNNIESFDFVLWFINNIQIFAVPAFCLSISPNQSYVKRISKALPVFLFCFSAGHFFLYQIVETTVIQAIIGFSIYNALLLIIKTPLPTSNIIRSANENTNSIGESKLSEEELVAIIRNMK